MGHMIWPDLVLNPFRNSSASWCFVDEQLCVGFFGKPKMMHVSIENLLVILLASVIYTLCDLLNGWAILQ